VVAVVLVMLMIPLDGVVLVAVVLVVQDIHLILMVLWVNMV
jgi:hypothetical protein